MAMIKCEECGNEEKSEYNFCSKCGAKLKKQKEINIKKEESYKNLEVKNMKNNQNFNKILPIFIIVLIMICGIMILMHKDIDSYKKEIPGVYKADDSFTITLLENGICNMYNPKASTPSEISISTNNCTWYENNKQIQVNYTMTATSYLGQTINQNDTLEFTYEIDSIITTSGKRYKKQ